MPRRGAEREKDARAPLRRCSVSQLTRALKSSKKLPFDEKKAIFGAVFAIDTEENVVACASGSLVCHWKVHAITNIPAAEATVIDCLSMKRVIDLVGSAQCLKS